MVNGVICVEPARYGGDISLHNEQVAAAIHKLACAHHTHNAAKELLKDLSFRYQNAANAEKQTAEAERLAEEELKALIFKKPADSKVAQ